MGSRVVGLGGIFFKARDPVRLRDWYRDHLGLAIDEWGGARFDGATSSPAGRQAATVWGMFPPDTEYFRPSLAAFMINYRVEHLDEVLAALRAEGCEVEERIEVEGPSMISMLRCAALVAVLALGGCGGDRPAARAPGAGGATSGSPPAASGGAEPSAVRPFHDPVQLTATVEVDGTRYVYNGLGECQHTADASIYQVPAAMWSTRFEAQAGAFRYLNLTLWQPKGASEMQLSLGLTTGHDTHEIATVKGADLRGSGQGRVLPGGAGGALRVQGKDAGGINVRLTVECSRFTEPVAEGG